jgi:cytochrome b involved in lipid metabolism
MPPKTAEKEYTETEVAKHTAEDDVWIILEGVVYDVTKFMDDHPGGPEIIHNQAGRDATDEFEEVFHSETAKKMLPEYRVGTVKGAKKASVKKTSEKAVVTPSATNPLLFVIPLLVVAGAAAYANFM